MLTRLRLKDRKEFYAILNIPCSLKCKQMATMFRETRIIVIFSLTDNTLVSFIEGTGHGALNSGRRIHLFARGLIVTV